MAGAGQPLRPRPTLIGVMGLVENMPDGKACSAAPRRCFVTTMSGQTVEVLNTDAEGRLVLCDALHWAQEQYDAARIVDLATLTGAMIIALGNEHGGMFANDGHPGRAADRSGQGHRRQAVADAAGAELRQADRFADRRTPHRMSVPREAGGRSPPRKRSCNASSGTGHALGASRYRRDGVGIEARPQLGQRGGRPDMACALLDQFVRDVVPPPPPRAGVADFRPHVAER